MHYVSTRNPDTRLSAAQAIVQGLSRDGGLFLPEEIPQISLEDIKALSLLPYPARAAKLMKLLSRRIYGRRTAPFCRKGIRRGKI